jgi:hypothetical protein
MLHPAIAQALVTAHIEDLHRTADRRHTIHLARRVPGDPRVAAIPMALGPYRSVVDERLGSRAGSDRASSNERCHTTPFTGGISSSKTCSPSRSVSARGRGSLGG